jgi:anti-sigma B factor antagonist
MSNSVTFREEGDVVVIDVCGKFTSERSSEAIRAMLSELVDAGYRNVLVNLAGTTYIDDSGLDELVAGYANLSRVNGTLKLLNPREPVEGAFCAAGLDSLFEKYEEESVAILSFYGRSMAA